MHLFQINNNLIWFSRNYTLQIASERFHVKTTHAESPLFTKKPQYSYSHLLNDVHDDIHDDRDIFHGDNEEQNARTQ